MKLFIMIQPEKKNINLHKSSIMVHLIELFGKISKHLCLWAMIMIADPDVEAIKK